MKYPTVLDKSSLDMDMISKKVFDSGRLSLDSPEAIKHWIEAQNEDIYIFKRNEPGFEDWSERDYCNNMTQNHFEPYAIFTDNYVVMHDYI